MSNPNPTAPTVPATVPPTASPTVPPAPTPADKGIRSWSINGKQTRVQTGAVKGGKQKGQPLFKFIWHPEDPTVKPTLANVVDLLTNLDIADDTAIIIDREILKDLAHEVSLRVTEVTPEQIKTLNPAKIPAAAKAVIAEYLKEREQAKDIAAQIAALSEEYRATANTIIAASIAGKNINADPELKAAANKVSQLTMQIAELNKKLENAKRKPAAAPAAAAAPATAPAAAASGVPNPVK